MSIESGEMESLKSDELNPEDMESFIKNVKEDSDFTDKMNKGEEKE